MKCSLCKRRMGKTMDARAEHYAKYHPERVIAAGKAIFVSMCNMAPNLRGLGETLARAAKEKLGRG